MLTQVFEVATGFTGRANPVYSNTSNPNVQMYDTAAACDATLVSHNRNV